MDDPQGPSQGFDRVFRGGAWLFPALLCRAAYRDKHEPWYRGQTIGFRVAATLTEESNR